MIYSNDSLGAIYACERARTGNYGMDEEYDDSFYYDDEYEEEFEEEDEEDY